MSGSAPRTATAALHQESFQRAGTWTHKNPGPFGPITAENRAAIQRLLAADQLWPRVSSAGCKLRTAGPAFIGPASGSLNGDQRDSVLHDLEISTIRKDSKGTWQFHSQRDPDALPIYCKACRPSKKGASLIFQVLKLGVCMHCRLTAKRRSSRFRPRFEPQCAPELPLQGRRPWNVADDPQSGKERPKRTPRETKQAPKAGNRGATAAQKREKSQKSRQHGN